MMAGDYNAGGWFHDESARLQPIGDAHETSVVAGLCGWSVRSDMGDDSHDAQAQDY